MYNMDISIGSYKFRIEIILLIIVVSWIMFGHILCSCCTMSFKEGLCCLRDATEKIIDTDPNCDRDPTCVDEVEEEVEQEGFIGSEFSSSNAPGYIMKPDTWPMPDLTYSEGTVPDAGVQAIENRPQQPIPLPEGQLDIFATTPFKPECCPNTYSSSEGCACMTTEQYGYLQNRGGNNVPYSEY